MGIIPKRLLRKMHLSDKFTQLEVLTDRQKDKISSKVLVNDVKDTIIKYLCRNTNTKKAFAAFTEACEKELSAQIHTYLKKPPVNGNSYSLGYFKTASLTRYILPVILVNLLNNNTSALSEIGSSILLKSYKAGLHEQHRKTMERENIQLRNKFLKKEKSHIFYITLCLQEGHKFLTWKTSLERWITW